jgi:hypothetical protein
MYEKWLVNNFDCNKQCIGTLDKTNCSNFKRIVVVLKHFKIITFSLNFLIFFLNNLGYTRVLTSFQINKGQKL